MDPRPHNPRRSGARPGLALGLAALSGLALAFPEALGGPALSGRLALVCALLSAALLLSDR